MFSQARNCSGGHVHGRIVAVAGQPCKRCMFRPEAVIIRAPGHPAGRISRNNNGVSSSRSGNKSDNLWTVHKFGGTSVADAECFRRVTGLLHAETGKRQAVVVSAMGGMTNSLLALIADAESGTDAAPGVQAIRERYTATAGELLSDADARERVLAVFEEELGAVADILNSVLARRFGRATQSGHRGRLW